MNNFNALSNRLSKSTQPLCHINYCLEQVECLQAYDLHDFSQLQLLGFPIIKTSENYATLKTALTPINEQIFCIVDIEASANDIKHGQIIEIGAILVQNNKQIDKFESLIYADELPQNISELTGITLEQLKNAPSIRSVLEKFRLFIKDAIFVAHNVNFDYKFISDSLQYWGFGPLLNRKLCTIELAKKTIKAQKYGLENLKDELNLQTQNRHRAYWDAYMAMQVFEKSLQNLPEDVFTTEELIHFSRPNTKKQKQKKQK